MYLRPSAQKNPDFVFLHHESAKLLAWPKYKAKECWTLVLCIMKLRKVTQGAVIVHNWWGGSSLRFTRGFASERAASIDPRLARAPIIEPHSGPLLQRLIALFFAVLLAMLPVTLILKVTGWLFPSRIDTLGVYADGHLAGYALICAARAKGSKTLSLHHGLYRNDDVGAMMMISNFVADHICLWNDLTRQSFLQAGISPERLIVVGEYGFGHVPLETEVVRPDLVLLCPPYDERHIETFRKICAELPSSWRKLWSLHPLLRAAHPDLEQVTVATISPRPRVAICGDSGVLMEALARNIPIITVSERVLASAHIPLEDTPSVDGARLTALVDKAEQSLDADRAFFGFDPLSEKASIDR